MKYINIQIFDLKKRNLFHICFCFNYLYDISGGNLDSLKVTYKYQSVSLQIRCQHVGTTILLSHPVLTNQLNITLSSSIDIYEIEVFGGKFQSISNMCCHKKAKYIKNEVLSIVGLFSYIGHLNDSVDLLHLSSSVVVR